MGYKGFSVSEYHFNIFIKDIIIPNDIIMFHNKLKHIYQFCFEEDKRDLYMIDIFSINRSIKYIKLTSYN
jgi:hypothetical protein